MNATKRVECPLEYIRKNKSKLFTSLDQRYTATAVDDFLSGLECILEGKTDGKQPNPKPEVNNS